MNEQAFFESLSDETRRRILVLILMHDELCVCELFQALDVPQPKVSRHLAVLRDAGVLTQRREGLWIHYRIHPLLPAWGLRILDQMLQGCAERELFRADRLRLDGMPNRPARCQA